jgi:hypothetical protein
VVNISTASQGLSPVARAQPLEIKALDLRHAEQLSLNLFAKKYAQPIRLSNFQILFATLTDAQSQGQAESIEVMTRPLSARGAGSSLESAPVPHQGVRRAYFWEHAKR